MAGLGVTDKYPWTDCCKKEEEPTKDSHGHDHGGKPCGGHGDKKEAEKPKDADGHNHGGKPCGGHKH